jgi:methionyl-tRNA synthetase
MIERKCLQCGTWNKDEDHCMNCGEPISPKEIDRVETNKRLEAEANLPKDKWELLMDRMKHHQSVFVRVMYKVIYSIGIVFAAIGGFFAWLIAMANG